MVIYRFHVHSNIRTSIELFHVVLEQLGSKRVKREFYVQNRQKLRLPCKAQNLCQNITWPPARRGVSCHVCRGLHQHSVVTFSVSCPLPTCDGDSNS